MQFFFKEEIKGKEYLRNLETLELRAIERMQILNSFFLNKGVYPSRGVAVTLK